METTAPSPQWGAKGLCQKSASNLSAECPIYFGTSPKAKNLLGAFADGAILFPLLSALSAQGQLSTPLLLASAGAAYWISGLVFRIPMPVQPLKSLVITALALGATSAEIRWSTAALGGTCLLLAGMFDVNRLAQKVPYSLIHGLQLGLGLLLVTQAVKQGQKAMMGGSDLLIFVIPVILSMMILILSKRIRFPAIGWFATAGFIGAAYFGAETPLQLPIQLPLQLPRISILAALILPQIPLTLGNSVIGTQNCAQQYFGEQASRVTIRRLLHSIGAGNLLSALMGGMPFCHGSGGLTAHVKGGANHWISNAWIGTVLLALALLSATGKQVSFTYPPMFSIALLMTIGIFHMGLAASTWRSFTGKIKLIIMGTLAVATQNLLWVLAGGILCEWILSRE